MNLSFDEKQILWWLLTQASAWRGSYLPEDVEKISFDKNIESAEKLVAKLTNEH
jgi:hypothetical protein